MPDLRAVVAAAGRGTRLGVSYPKTLVEVGGEPILVRLLKLLRPYDAVPAVVVSPAGKEPVRDCLDRYRMEAELIVQCHPTGMGDAVLEVGRNLQGRLPRQLMLVWGDIPFLQPATIAALEEAHTSHRNDFTFPTRIVESAYTLVKRDADGLVTGVSETRESGDEIGPGERDIGVFLFRTEPVLSLLEKRLAGAIGNATAEHGFLYVIRHLAEAGYRIEALPVATGEDLLSLNSPADLEQIEQHAARMLPR